jgi:hypothetical protein
MDDEAVKNTVERIKTGRLSVEALLESQARSKLRPLRRPLSEAKFETRWAMERGLYAVLGVRQSRPAENAEDFETLENKAKKAHSAIDELLQYLDSNARKGADLELALLTAQESRKILTLALFTIWPAMTASAYGWRVKFLSASQRPRLARKRALGRLGRGRRNPKSCPLAKVASIKTHAGQVRNPLLIYGISTRKVFASLTAKWRLP